MTATIPAENLQGCYIEHRKVCGENAAVFSKKEREGLEVMFWKLESEALQATA